MLVTRAILTILGLMFIFSGDILLFLIVLGILIYLNVEEKKGEF